MIFATQGLKSVDTFSPKNTALPNNTMEINAITNFENKGIRVDFNACAAETANASKLNDIDNIIKNNI